MKNVEFTPKESFEVINEVISGAKARMSENGFVYLFWGWLISLCALGQFVLLQTGYADINYYPYFITIPGAIYTAIHEARKHRSERSPNYTSNIMSAIWITAGANMLIVGFLFSPVLQSSPVPHILIILALATVASGAALKFQPLIWGGIVCNLAGIAAIFIGYAYHPLFVILGIVAADLIPGYILRNKSKNSYA
ncbi:MAG: hypothetical protein U5L09_20250 [Bacteroidales bacterium]|nr:hypothetical protein [Bacteroidales bacterium]